MNQEQTSLLSRLVALDLEGYLIEEGLLAPPVVCASFARFEDGRPVGRLVAPGETRREKALGVVGEARELLRSDAIIVGANNPFDFGCLVAEDPTLVDLVFKAYAKGRVHDVQTAQSLHAIACGNLGIDPSTGAYLKGSRGGDDQAARYSLDLCVKLVLGRSDAKAHDEWRRRYAMLADLRVEDWPEKAKVYPVDDVKNPLEVAAAQLLGGGKGPTPGPHRNLGDLRNQCETHWAMHLGAMWGIRVDRESVQELRARVERDHAAFVKRFAKFFKSDGKKDSAVVKRAVARAYGGELPPCGHCVNGKTLSKKTGNSVNCDECSGTGLELSRSVPRTPSGGVQTDRDSLAESGDSELVAYGDNEPEKIRATYLPWLEQGLYRPLTLRPNVLVASGRTSYDGLIQLLPRQVTCTTCAGRKKVDGAPCWDCGATGIVPGVRECIRARGTWLLSKEELARLNARSRLSAERVFCSVDYAAIEMCTLSQFCLWVLGWSSMAEAIQRTGSPGMLHTSFGATLRGWSVDEMVSAIEAGDKTAKNYRWAAKACNFGLPGGMGAPKFVLTQRRKSAGSTVTPDGKVVYPGLRFCVLLAGADRCGVEKVTEWRGRDVPAMCRVCLEVVAKDLRPAWFKEWQEIKHYHDWVSSLVDSGSEFPCLVPGLHGPVPSRMRGGLDFSAGANNGFQALAADGAKAALRALVRECYTGLRTELDLNLEPVVHSGPPSDSEVWRSGTSPLLGTRPIFFAHDEIVSEMPLDRADEASRRKTEVMVKTMQRYVPDVPVNAEPALMFHWSKLAEARYDDRRRLVPWDVAKSPPWASA